MNLPTAIESDPLLFDKLLAPLEPILSDLDHTPVSQAAGKLKFALFVRLLLFRLFAQVVSLRDLVQDLKTSPLAHALGLPSLGLSTLHDAFARYSVAMLRQLFQHLTQSVALAVVPELQTLGQLWCVDSSLWPVVRQLGWLTTQGVQGVRLHLAFSLTTLTPVTFLLSYDKSPTAHERRSLRALLTSGVTYILDRGYVDLTLCLEIITAGGYFVLRERNNLRYRVLAEVEVQLEAAFHFVHEVSDRIVLLQRGGEQAVLRLVHFTLCGHEFHLLTNRFDLGTAHLIMLYAWRWQVELIFRAWKHTLSGLHLINLSEAGIEMQFYVLAIASVLWAAFQQCLSPTPAVTAAQPKTPTSRLSQVFRVRWRLLRQTLRLLRNCLARPYVYYVKELIEQRL